MPVMPDKAVFVSSAALCTALPGKLLYLSLQKQHLVAKNELEFSFRPTQKDQQVLSFKIDLFQWFRVDYFFWETITLYTEHFQI